MAAQRQTIPVVTDASGNATVYSTLVSGTIEGIRIVVPGSGGIDTTADFTITAEQTGETILAVSNVAASGSYYPRVPTGKAADASACLYAAAGETVFDRIVIANDRVKVVCAQGGNTKQCTIYVLLS